MKRPALRLALTAGLATAALATVGAALGGPALAADASPRASVVAVQQPAPDDGPGRPDRDCPRGAERGEPAPPAQPAPGQPAPGRPVAGTAL